jgi:hypothetical protein
MIFPLSPATDSPTSSTPAEAHHPREVPALCVGRDEDPGARRIKRARWIPACAGMTDWRVCAGMTERLARHDGDHTHALRDRNDAPCSPGCPREGWQPVPSARFISRSAMHLLLATATLAAVWLLLLPALLQLAPIRNHVDYLDAHEVDASAMYYTELDPEFLIDNRTAGDAK